MAPTSNKKLDTTIVAALIGLCGTVIVALLTSPTLISRLSRTPEPTTASPGTEAAETAAPPATVTPEIATPTDFPLPTSTTEPGLTDTLAPGPDFTATLPQPTPAQAVLVFSEDFSDDTASGFGFGSGQWSISKDRGNAGLQGMADSPETPAAAVFGPSDFSDGVIEFQVKFKTPGTLLLDFRNDGTQTYTLLLSAAQGNLTAGYRSADGDWEMQPLAGSSTRPLTLAEDAWYTVRLEVSGGEIAVWVDGNRLMSLTDSRLAEGFLAFGVESPAVVVLDNVKVWDSGP